MKLIKGSNLRISAFAVSSVRCGSTRRREEMVRLLLQTGSAIKVFFSFSDEGKAAEPGKNKSVNKEEKPKKAYYQQTAYEVLEQVNGGPTPLDEEELRARQRRYGPNELAEGKKKSVPQIFLEQFRDFLVLILIAAAAVSGFLGDVESAVVILIVITMNAILGTVQTV